MKSNDNTTLDPRSRDAGRADERGSVLVIILVLMLGFAGLAQATLAKTAAEQRKEARRFLARQVLVEADGQLALAQNIVNASTYTDLSNDALDAAISDPNGLMPNTDVIVEQVPGTSYFALRTIAERNGVTKSAEAVVRERSPASAFNLFVIDHPVGISGQPRGAIHTNRYIDFFFSDSVFRDPVTASEGFQFIAGATEENTTFLGEVNATAPKKNLLEGIDFTALEAEADSLSVPENYIAEIELDGAYGTVDLYEPAHTQIVTKTRTVQVVTGHETETYFDLEPIKQTVTFNYPKPVFDKVEYQKPYKDSIYEYQDIQVEVTEPVYEEQEVTYTVEEPIIEKQTLTHTVEKKVWVSFADQEIGAKSSGGTVGASSNLDGYWTTKTVEEEYEADVVIGHETVTKTKKEKVKIGEQTKTVTQKKKVKVGEEIKFKTKHKFVFSHMETATGTKEITTGYQPVLKTKQVPIYEDVVETYQEEVFVDETFVRSETFSTDGTVYLGGDVRKIEGKIDGRMSLIANGEIRITDNIQYVDSDGDTRMKNGLDPDEQYVENPDYEGDALLALMAKNDLVYAHDGPEKLEVNASLMSVEGSVGFEGIVVTNDGENVATAYETSVGDVVKDSLRRLGGIVSRHRPVATYIDEFGWIGAGFERGTSIMDRNLLLSSGNNAPPPFTFEAPQPTWILTTSGSRLGEID